MNNHNLSPADIDKAAILPLPCLSLINLSRKRYGIVTRLSVNSEGMDRDFPKWKGSQDTVSVQLQSSGKKNQPHYIVEYFLTTFCNNLNCITGFCATHRMHFLKPFLLDLTIGCSGKPSPNSDSPENTLYKIRGKCVASLRSPMFYTIPVYFNIDLLRYNMDCSGCRFSFFFS